MNILALLVLLGGTCFAEESVDGLIRASNYQNPVASFATGFQQGFNSAPARANQALENERLRLQIESERLEFERLRQERQQAREEDQRAQAMQAKKDLQTVQGFLDNCDASGDFCDGVLTGSILMAYEGKPKGICLPKTVAYQQIFEAFRRWLDNNPSKAQANMLNTLPIIFRKAFPCKPKK